MYKRQEHRPHHSIKVSLRRLCRLAAISTSVFPDALKALEDRNLVTVRHGGTHHQSAYKVNFFDTICASFSDAPASTGASNFDAPVTLFSMHSASIFDAPPPENTALTRAAAASDFDGATLRLIDRVYSATAKDFDPEDIATFRRWMHGHFRKFGRDENNRPIQDPHPPSNDQVAKLLAVADVPRLARLLQDLLHEQHSFREYIWFPAVALQRIHGINTTRQKEGRAMLRDVKRTRPPLPEQTPLDLEHTDTAAMIRDAAAGLKKLR